MFKFLKKGATSKSQTLKFDEQYCHFNGEKTGAKTYKIDKGTTEIVFDFGNFDHFWETYVNKNPHLPEKSLNALKDNSGVFCAQIVEDRGTYIYTDGINDQNQMVFNAKTLKRFGAKEEFKQFKKGIIAFGIYHLGKLVFDVLWGTAFEEK